MNKEKLNTLGLYKQDKFNLHLIDELLGVNTIF